MKTFNLLLSALLVVGMAVSAQDTTFYKEGKKVQSIVMCDQYTVTIYDEQDKNRRIIQTYNTSGMKIKEVHEKGKPGKIVIMTGLPKINWMLDGMLSEWYASGPLYKQVRFTDGSINGKLILYWENGQLKREDIFENHKFIKGTCFDSQGNETDYFPYETMPQFPGGEQALMSYLSREIRYPVEAMKAGIQGRVIMHFVVSDTGEIEDIHVVRSVSTEIDREALRVVRQLPLWIPGTRDGKPAKIAFTLPISFKML